MILSQSVSLPIGSDGSLSYPLWRRYRDAFSRNLTSASDEGYGMCSYLRFVYEDSSIQCSFLIGKSKAMRARPISIPWLELQAATVSARIYQVCREELTYKIERVVFCMDRLSNYLVVHQERKQTFSNLHSQQNCWDSWDNQSRPMETLPRKIESSLRRFPWF